MDACQFFNFLYGPKRARAELSRCFANIGQNLSPKKAPKQNGESTTNKSIGGSINSGASDTGDDKQTSTRQANGCQEAPVSPLRQLRMKINCYASGLASTVKASKASLASQVDTSLASAASASEFATSGQAATNLNCKTPTTGAPTRMRVRNLRQCQHKSQPAGSMLEHCQDQNNNSLGQQNSGTYRAHLIKSLSFDEFGEVKIYDLIDGIDPGALESNRKSAHLKQQVHAKRHLDQLELEPVDFESLHEDLREQLDDLTCLSFERCNNSISNSSHQSPEPPTIERVVLYGDASSQVSDFDGCDSQPTLISSAEIYNIQVSQATDQPNSNNQSCQLRKVRSLSIQADSCPPPPVQQADRKGSDQGPAATIGATKRGAYIRSLIQSFELGEAPNHSDSDSDVTEADRHNGGFGHADGRGFVTSKTSTNNNVAATATAAASTTTPTTDFRATPKQHVADEKIGLQADLGAGLLSSSSSRPSSRQASYQASGGQQRQPTPKPVSLVKPLPPKTPPKTNKAKCLTIQLSLNKPDNLEQLFCNDQFLARFFCHLDPLDRCQAAQVCRQWRQVLYSNPAYWTGLICAIDYTQLRREYLLECIVNTIQSAKLRLLKEQSSALPNNNTNNNTNNSNSSSNNNNNSNNYSSTTTVSSGYRSCGSSQATMRQSLRSRFANLPSELASANVCCTTAQSTNQQSTEPDAVMPSIRSNRTSDDATLYSVDSISLYDIDQDDMWRIQELCQRFTQRSGPGHGTNATLSRCDTLTLATSATTSATAAAASSGDTPSSNQTDPIGTGGNQNQSESMILTNLDQQQQQQQQQQTSQSSQCTASQSSSIPSQISSTLSSISLSSIMSALTEMSRTEIIRDKLYESIETRAIDAITLIGATNEDANDLINQLSSESIINMSILRLNNCFLDDAGVERLLESFDQIDELELTSCNEITNNIGLSNLKKVKHLTITDCINISDGIAFKISEVFHLLDGLVIQAYHLSDCFTDYLGVQCNAGKLKRLELQNCKSTSNSSLISVVRHYKNLTSLSVTGSKIDDEGIEILTGGSQNLISLDISWCPALTDVSLECIACDLTDCLQDLKIDRNVNITDHGLIYLTRMKRLKLLYVRWCPRITDIGLEAILKIDSLRNLSLAGLQQLTTRTLCSLTATKLTELELTNCPSVTNDLKNFLTDRMPNCNITF